jgi:hypothetical protein
MPYHKLSLFFKKKFTKVYFFINDFFSVVASIFNSKSISKISKYKTIYSHIIRNSIFIETGCYYGQTIEKFYKYFIKSYSIEPSLYLHNITSKRLKKIKSIEIINGTSEDKFENIIKSNLKYDLTLWLDGHFSNGETYKNNTNSSLNHEIKIIDKYLENMKNISVMIDDIHLLRGNDGYPEINKILNYFKSKNFMTLIDNNILVAKKIY